MSFFIHIINYEAIEHTPNKSSRIVPTDKTTKRHLEKWRDSRKFRNTEAANQKTEKVSHTKRIIVRLTGIELAEVTRTFLPRPNVTPYTLLGGVS